MKSENYKYIIELLILLIVLSFLSGCTNVQNPEITIEKVSITDISLQKMTLRADIEIYNPNSLELDVSNLDIAISYKDGDTIEKMGSGTTNPIKIPGKTREKIAIPIIVNNYDVIKTVLTFVTTGELNIITTGSCQFNAMMTQNTVSFTHEMSLSFNQLDTTIRDKIQELNLTVQGTKNTLDKVTTLITDVKEEVGGIMEIMQNESAPSLTQ